MPWAHAIERSLGADGALIAGAIVVVALLFVVHGLRRAGYDRLADGMATVFLVVALAGVAIATLRPASGLPDGVSRRLILDPVFGATDGYGHTVWRPLWANVALFVPAGAFAAARFPGRGLRVLAALVLASVAVEATQYVLPIGRIANAADVVANAGGAAIGIAVDRVSAGLAGDRRHLERESRAPVTARRRP